MSQFIGGALPNFLLCQNDVSLWPKSIERIDLPYWPDLFGGRTYQTAFWPGSANFYGMCGVDFTYCNPVWWQGVEVWRGANGRFGLRGVTRDEFGSRLGNVTIKLFRTADDTLQASVVSDVEGNFLVTSPFLEGHYQYIITPGPPMRFGASANNLIPS